MASVLPYAVAAVVLYGAIWLLSEQAMRYLYDQLVDGLWWRSLLTAVALAALIVWKPVQFDTMFTEQFLWTLVHAAAWILCFWLILRYLLPHAIALGGVSFLLLSTLVTMAAQNFAARGA